MNTLQRVILILGACFLVMAMVTTPRVAKFTDNFSSIEIDYGRYMKERVNATPGADDALYALFFEKLSPRVVVWQNALMRFVTVMGVTILLTSAAKKRRAT